MALVPSSKPKMKRDEILALAKAAGLKGDGVCVVGVRGYYKDSMGKPGVNDRGLYDDGLFIVGLGENETFASFNANTDPSSYRKGRGFGDSKGMADLSPGLYHAHQLGLHRGKYLALIQTGGEVTVIRDGTPNYPDTGWFGINIHKGGYNTTSSLGCQTIYPEQWDSFIALAKNQMHAHKQSIMPYLLVEA